MKQLSGILSLIGFSNLAAPSPFSALPPVIYHNASPKAISGENQLYPSSIGISPLSTSHPRPFQRTWVRSSTVSYHRFNLLMDRSPGFGSNASNYVALFRLALAAPPELQFLKLATYINSPDRSTKSTRSLINELSVLVGTRFQVLFHSPPGVFSPFPHGTASLSVTE